MILNNITKLTCLLCFIVLLSACDGGGDDGGGGETTSFTVSTFVDAGGQISPATATVNEGGYANFSITPIDGFSLASVTGCGGALAGSTYTTGAVTADCTVTAIFNLVGGALTVSGLITFDHIPTSTTLGLDYAAQTAEPARGVVVEAIRASDNSRVGLATTDASGAYSITLPTATNTIIRVKAQMLTIGSPSWDIQVVDNTNSQALYAMESSVFNSGAVDILGKNLHAPSGWGGASYSSARVAAPFAILNTVYQAVDKVVAADAAVDLPQLLINWSVNNVAVAGDTTIGEIRTSMFSQGELYILGHANNDTDEYDSHIIAHEWGHYFEAVLSRADSIGGSHSSGQKLDPRIAFGEGFGNAFSGMVTDDADYVDTLGPIQGQTGILMNLEDNDYDTVSVGWYSTSSVQSILYDLYDSVDDGGVDTVSLGFTPIYNVLVNEQKNTDSFTTMHSFMSFIKANTPADISAINTLLSYENITTTAQDEWDSTQTETNSGGEVDGLPLYIPITVGAAALSVCTHGANGNYNKLMNRRFLRVNIPTASSYTVTAVPDIDGDAVIDVFKKGTLVGSRDSVAQGATETLIMNFASGWHVIEIFDYDVVYTAYSGEECFEVAIN